MSDLSRREMFAVIAATLGAAGLDHAASASLEARIDEYGFAPGLICLDSGSFGLTLRSRRLRRILLNVQAERNTVI